MEETYRFHGRVRIYRCRRIHSIQFLGTVMLEHHARSFASQYTQQRTFIILTYIRLIVHNRHRPDRARAPLRSHPHRLRHLLRLLYVTLVRFLPVVLPVVWHIITIPIVRVRSRPLRHHQLLRLITSYNITRKSDVRLGRAPLDVWTIVVVCLEIQIAFFAFAVGQRAFGSCGK